MASKPPIPELTAEQARALLKYEPETGRLFWLARPREMFSSYLGYRAWNGRFAGAEAFTSNMKGYRQGGIFARAHYAHRVIWLIQTGDWPKADIDHINGDRSDNRWANLRDASRTENAKNAFRKSSNTSGVNGVYRRKGKWRAQIRVDGRSTYLGDFDSLDDAAAARAAADVKYGFTGRHGS